MYECVQSIQVTQVAVDASQLALGGSLGYTVAVATVEAIDILCYAILCYAILYYTILIILCYY